MIYKLKILNKDDRLNANFTNREKALKHYNHIVKYIEKNSFDVFGKIDFENFKKDIQRRVYYLKHGIYTKKCECCEKESAFKSFVDGYNPTCGDSLCVHEYIAKMNRGRIQTNEEKEKRAAKLRGRKRPEHSKLLIEMFNTPKYKKIFSEKSKISMTPARRKKQSETMKRMIADGTFTPCITNKWTHWSIEVQGKKFRSSFEGIFYTFCKFYKIDDIKYEKVRIPYTFERENKTYIVDFSFKNYLFEIKPINCTEFEKYKINEGKKIR